MNTKNTLKKVNVTKTLPVEEKNIWKIISVKRISILYLFISAFLFVVGVNIFLASARTLSTGISAIPQLIIFSIPNSEYLQQFYSLILLGLNIPIILIFWNKIKRSFFVLTIIWLLFQVAWGFTLGTPIINNFIIKQTVTAIAPRFIGNFEVDTWAILVFSFMGALFSGLGVAIAWKNGASTGGTDIIAYYFSTKRKINVSIPITALALIISFLSILVLTIISSNNTALERRQFFGMSTLGTILYVLISSFLVKIIYPKYSKIMVSIHSAKHEEILQMLKNIDYWHGYSVYKLKSGYSGKTKYKIESAILLLEFPKLKSRLLEVDPNIWISIKPIRKIIGSFNSSKVD